MRSNIIAAIALSAASFAAMPAHAGDWAKSVDACAAAAEAEGVVTAGAYRAKFLAGSGASVKTLSIELTPDNGDAVTAQCKIRRGEVTEFAVKA